MQQLWNFVLQCTADTYSDAPETTTTNLHGDAKYDRMHVRAPMRKMKPTHEARRKLNTQHRYTIRLPVPPVTLSTARSQ